MRKQTKLVAVASAAALLAIGASMTSFAATGWVEEDGQWYYYNKDGSRAEDEWKKSGNNWYWLDSENGGAMATDKLIDDNNNTYYVDSNGVMVSNTWVKIVNEDQDENTDPAEYRYYYMQSNGKAYKAGTSNETKLKTIDGKKYAFDADGKMLYGWVDLNSEMKHGESEWKEATYYFGGWEDGSMKTGWQKINVYDAKGDEDDDADKWFYFNSNGKRFELKDEDATTKTLATKKINGKTYGFDEYGVMSYEWRQAASGSDASASNWGYFRSPEDGARVTKGWFKVVPDEAFDLKNSDEENEKWYYSNGDGTLVTSEIKKINGKYYAFDDKGVMLKGLVQLTTENGTIVSVDDDDVDADELDDLIEADYVDGLNLYYFGDENDGAMKTGSTTVKLDGDSYAFHFATTGGADSRGQGTSGIVKKVHYKYGKKMAASSEDKYRAGRYDTDYAEVITLESSKDIRANSEKLDAYKLVNGRRELLSGVKYINLSGMNAYLIGTNGQLKKKATGGVKDGDDWYFFSNADGKIIYYANDKDFTKSTVYSAWKASNWE